MKSSSEPAGLPSRSSDQQARRGGERSWTGGSSRLADVLTLLVGLIVALAAGEAATRLAGRVLHRIPIVASHPMMGWTGRSNLHRAAKTYSGGTFRMSTDSLGHRLSYPSEQSPADDSPVILLAGDSFVQGVGVEDEATVGRQLANTLRGHHVINLGIAGYGSDQELLSIEDYFRTGSHSVSDIVVVVYENDFRDVQKSFDFALARSKPVFRVSGQQLERGSYALSLLDRLMDHSHLVWLVRSKITYRFRPPEVRPESGVDVVVACLEEIRRVGRAHHARVQVVAHRQLGPPYGHASEMSDELWREFIQKSGALDMTESIRAGPGPAPIGFDGLHWSVEGTRRAADAIRGALSPVPPR